MNDIKAIKILENINKGYVDFNYSKDSIDAIHELKELQATIEAQEVIIKAMAQPKTCEGCEWANVYKVIHNSVEICAMCLRGKQHDYYEPKAQP